MNADLFQILVFGSLVVLFAFTALALLVRRDLAPTGAFAGALDGGGRWFLGGALGMGVIAFTIKLVIISTLATFPDQTIDGLLPDAEELQARALAFQSSLTPASNPEPAEIRRGPWQALPVVAPAPADNPTTDEKVALGLRLFNDPALSADRTVACASCHDITRAGGADGRATAKGIGGQIGGRNTPTVMNAAFQARLFWDGRAASLEEQAKGPLVNPIEMGMPSLAAVEERVRSDPTYRPDFDRAFGPGTPITIDAIAKAIAAFERTLISADTPYDRFVRGDDTALTVAQQRGMVRFEKLGCVMCHSGPNFSGASTVGPRSPYAALRDGGSGLVARYHLLDDKGKAPTTAKEGIWRVPTLRNIAATGPYFHNGSVSDLSEAVRVMADSQLRALLGSPTTEDRVRLRWSPEHRLFESVERLVVTDQDVADLVDFLRALGS